jgi:hypothetical protein
MTINSIGQWGWLRGLAIAFGVAIIWGNTAFGAQLTVKGTATLADGTALAKGTVMLVDNGGHLPLAAVASNAGKFKFNVTGLTPPFLLQSTPAGGAPLFYGFAQAPGIADVDVYTDLILNMILNAAGTTTVAEFTTPTGLPTANQVQSIAPTIQKLILHWLAADKVSTKKFSFDGLNFAPGKSKFGKVLRQTCDNSGCGGSVFAGGSETLAISDGTTTQTIIFTSTIPPDGSAFGGFTADSSTVVLAEVTASLQAAASIPVGALGSSILDGLNALLTQLQTTVNSKGAKLADTDLLPLFDPNYLRGGNLRAEAAANLATNLRRVKMSNIQVNLLHWTAPDVADNTQTDVNINYAYSASGTLVPSIDETFRCTAANVCLFYGDQQIAETPGAVVLQELTNSSTSAVPTPVAGLAVNVTAPVGALSAVSVDDDTHTYFNATPVSFLQTTTEKLFPKPGTEADFLVDQFYLTDQSHLVPVPAPGTKFTVSITPTVGSPVSYITYLNGTSGEAINLIAPSFTGNHDISVAPIGKSLTLKWKLPASYTTESIDLSGSVKNAGCSATKVVHTAGTVAASATSAKIAFPSMIAAPGDIKELDLNLGIRGVNGETSRVLYTFGAC